MAFNGVGDATGHQPVFGTPEYMANVAGHAFVGCASAAAGGGDCGSGAMAAGFGAAAAPFAIGLGRDGGTIASAIIGGTASVLGGGRFANGAVTAAFGYLYNSQGDTYSRNEYRDSGKLVEHPVGDIKAKYSIPTKIKIPFLKVSLSIDIQFATQDYGQSAVYDEVKVQRWSLTGSPVTNSVTPTGRTQLHSIGNTSSVEKIIRLCVYNTCAPPTLNWK